MAATGHTRSNNGLVKIGFVINPIAGMGGRVGLKGTDGSNIYREAKKRGAKPLSHLRSREFVRAFSNHKPFERTPLLLLCRGVMGNDGIVSTLSANGIEYQEIYSPGTSQTTREHTKKAVSTMVDEGVELLVFAGGDGTARDVLSALTARNAEGQRVLGVPAGVKMHSSVFSLSPEAGGEIMAAYVKGETRTVKREIVDIDEESYRSDRLASKLYGYVRVPFMNKMIQSAKAGPADGDEAGIRGIGDGIAELIRNDEKWVYFLGAGTTVQAVKEELGISGTLLGVDAVMREELLARDIWEKDILPLIKENDGNIKMVISPIGRQGFLLGRGNQQFSPEVLEKIGIENIIVVATAAKLETMDDLIIYTGRRELDRSFPNYLKVTVAPDRYRMVKTRIA